MNEIDGILTVNQRRGLPIRPEEKWEPLAYVDATPDQGYVLRILRAHLLNAESGRWSGSDAALVADMNELQEKRAALLRYAIEKLEKP